MEDEKLGTSGSRIETNDDCSVVLELSGDDPQFGRKKKLLQDAGFDVKEQIHIQNSLCPATSVLEKMLQIARIIALDEVELYFNEDVSSPAELYSNRNEMEALNRILSLIDTSFSGDDHMCMGVVKGIRDAIIDRINNLEETKEETTIDVTYSCDKENGLMQWGESNGVKTRLRIACVEGYDRGAIAIEDMNVGDIALEIPLSIVISEETVNKSDMYQILDKIDGFSSETILLLWSIKEKHNSSSNFKSYFSSLPENFNTGLSFGVDAIMELHGSLLLEEIMQAKEHLRLQYDEFFPALCTEHPDIFPPELYTWDQFLWACELWYSNSMKVKFADGKLRTCLIPVAGFLNHSLQPHIVQYGKVDSATNSLKFPLSRPCKEGEQCYLSYGNFSGSHFATFYGFLPQGDNQYDVIPLDIEDSQSSSDEGCPTTNWSNHMLRGTWFSKNHDLFYYGLPSPLLNCLRRAHSHGLQQNISLPEKLDIEKEILENLKSIFGTMMDNLDEKEYVDRTNAKWDVKLAVEYKDIERRIVSSALTSCFSGLSVIEDELSKCDR